MGAQLASTLVVGLGNPILSDDGIGWWVAEAVHSAVSAGTGGIAANGSLRVVKLCVGGLALAEQLIGYRRAVVIDAMLTGQAEPGSVHHFRLVDLPGTLNTASAHDTNLATAVRALRRFGADLPADDAVAIVAVEAQDVWTFAESCTAAVQDAVPRATALVFALLRQEE
jgi:hydrogenase maturation protease